MSQVGKKKDVLDLEVPAPYAKDPAGLDEREINEVELPVMPEAKRTGDETTDGPEEVPLEIKKKKGKAKLISKRDYKQESIDASAAFQVTCMRSCTRFAFAYSFILAVLLWIFAFSQNLLEVQLVDISTATKPGENFITAETFACNLVTIKFGPLSSKVDDCGVNDYDPDSYFSGSRFIRVGCDSADDSVIPANLSAALCAALPQDIDRKYFDPAEKMLICALAFVSFSLCACCGGGTIRNDAVSKQTKVFNNVTDLYWIFLFFSLALILVATARAEALNAFNLLTASPQDIFLTNSISPTGIYSKMILQANAQHYLLAYIGLATIHIGVLLMIFYSYCASPVLRESF